MQKCKSAKVQQCHCLILVVFLAVFSTSLLAQGFWDQGLISGHVRTDYNHPSRGSFGLPISYTFPSPYFSCAIAACGNSPTGFPQSNAWSNGNFWSPNYWVLSFNNEVAFNVKHTGGTTTYTHNPGPPNQSLPRSAPGAGLMGFTVLKDTGAGEYFNRAHMVLNTYFPNPEYGGIPFMAIGAQSNRGNGSVLGYLNGPWWYKDNVSFKEKVYAIDLPSQVPGTTQPPTLWSYIYIVSEWAGKQRGMFINLYHWNLDVSNATNDPGDNLRWNWPIQQSFYYPGADIAYMDAEDIVHHCGIYVPRLGYTGQQINYNLDLTALFQCASNKGLFEVAMPAGIHPIKGIHWAVEGTGINGALWIAVHDMKMLI